MATEQITTSQKQKIAILAIKEDVTWEEDEKSKGIHIAKEGINEGYQPSKSVSTQPPNKGSNIQPAKTEKYKLET